MLSQLTLPKYQVSMKLVKRTLAISTTEVGTEQSCLFGFI